MLFDFPGELRCVEVELTNSGPVAAANIHLVSRTPGLLSFGKKAASDPASLFEFPLVEKNQAPLRLVQEDGTVTQVKKYHSHHRNTGIVLYFKRFFELIIMR
jgi:hypothetical protein